MKPLTIIYIVFVLQSIYEANNNLFPVVVCDFRILSSADPTVNADIDCMFFAAIKVNI